MSVYKNIMLNISHLKFCRKAGFSTSLLKQSFQITNYAVREVRGQYMYVIDDPNRQLQYMREVETNSGRKGIVLKFQEQGSTYIGMYECIQTQQQHTLSLKSSNIPWQKSFESIIPMMESQTQAVLNINAKSIHTRKQKAHSINQQVKRRKLISLNPFLDICHDLNYGQMFNFSGCQGSHKTTTLSNIFRQFVQNHNHYALYFNPTSFSDAQRISQQAGCWSFNNGNHTKINQSDVGVYMLALKTINLAKKLSLLGKEVILGLDNFKSVLHAEWHMLQLLNNVRVRNQPAGANYNAIKIAPISLLNEIYSICEDNQKSRGSKKKGSLSAIIITDNNTDDQLMPEITPYSNNLKHLSSLAQNIKFPLVACQNSNINLQITQQKDSSLHNQKVLRNEINNYLQQKKDTELKRKLYRSDVTDAPWDYFAILDAEWWLQGLREVKPNSIQKLQHFINWTTLNIELELVPHWNIKSYQGYNKFVIFLEQKESKNINKANLFQFIELAKQQGWFSPFKKDYLK